MILIVLFLRFPCDFGASGVDVNSEPNGRFFLRGPRYTMQMIGRDKEMITRSKNVFRLALDPQACRPPEQQNPFVMVLIIRGFRRR